MRLPRMQFTIKRMLLVVAVATVIIGTSRVVWLRHGYLKVAAHYAATEDLYRALQRFEVEHGKKSEEELASGFGEQVSAGDREQRAAAVRAYQEQLAAENPSLGKEYRRIAERSRRTANRLEQKATENPP